MYSAIENLIENQKQLDADGCMVGVSRQALDEALALMGKMHGALKEAESALASCYQVCDYPANGRSEQDDALRSVQSVIAEYTA